MSSKKSNLFGSNFEGVEEKEKIETQSEILKNVN